MIQKNKLVQEIEKYEKKYTPKKKDLANIRKYKRVSGRSLIKSKSEYFKIRLLTLDKLLKRNEEKRGYRKIEFDRILKFFQRLKEDDAVEFLNEGIRNRIEKISEKLFHGTHQMELESEDNFYLLTYKSLSFIVRSYEKKILQEMLMQPSPM